MFPEDVVHRDLQNTVLPRERYWRKWEGSGFPRHVGFINEFDAGQEAGREKEFWVCL